MVNLLFISACAGEYRSFDGSADFRIFDGLPDERSFLMGLRGAQSGWPYYSMSDGAFLVL